VSLTGQFQALLLITVAAVTDYCTASEDWPSADYTCIRVCHSVFDPSLARGVVERGRGGGDGVPRLFSTGGTPPPLFWTEIRAKVSPLSIVYKKNIKNHLNLLCISN